MRKVLHFFLYILECMASVFIIFIGGTADELKTTGKRFSWKDGLICFICWTVVFIGVAFLIIYIRCLRG